MKRMHLYLILLSTLCVMVVSQGCTSPTCQDYIDHLETCEDKIVGTYGSKVYIEDKDNKAKRTVACQPETKRKDCGVGKYCIKAPGHATHSCYLGGNLYNRFRGLVEEVKTQCVPIFAVRQSGAKSYYSCIKAAACDLRKIDACRTLLTPEKPSKQSTLMMVFLIFLGLTLVLEGVFLFVVIKMSDRQNPKNTMGRALLLATMVAVVGFPAVYINPLIGMAISSSLLFGLIIILFYQGAGVPTLYTAIHILWVSVFFNYMVANQHIGNRAWLFESKTLRVAMTGIHDKLNEQMEEYEQTQKEIAAARIRAKKRAQEEAKQKALEKKRLEEAKRKEEAKQKDED